MGGCLGWKGGEKGGKSSVLTALDVHLEDVHEAHVQTTHRFLDGYLAMNSGRERQDFGIEQEMGGSEPFQSNEEIVLTLVEAERC